MDMTVPQRLYRLEKAQEEMSEALTRQERQLDRFALLVEGQGKLLDSILHDLKGLALAAGKPEPASEEVAAPASGPTPGCMTSYGQAGQRREFADDPRPEPEPTPEPKPNKPLPGTITTHVHRPGGETYVP